MDSEMIERVAKAIRLRDTTDEYAMARAAIKAMREPTEKMLHNTDIVYKSPEYSVIRNCWQAMIDAVIND